MQPPPRPGTRRRRSRPARPPRSRQRRPALRRTSSLRNGVEMRPTTRRRGCRNGRAGCVSVDVDRQPGLAPAAVSSCAAFSSALGCGLLRGPPPIAYSSRDRSMCVEHSPWNRLTNRSGLPRRRVAPPQRARMPPARTSRRPQRTESATLRPRRTGWSAGSQAQRRSWHGPPAPQRP